MKKILLVPGDGIGPEVMAAGQKLLNVLNEKFSLAFCFDEVDWGATRWLKDGVGLPKGILPEIPKKYDAILFGALGDPRIPDMAHGREILLGLRFGLDLFINMRPVKLLLPKLCPLKELSSPLDIMIFRENTQDIYLGLGEVSGKDTCDEVTIDHSRHTFAGVHRIVEAAFDYAVKNNRKRVTLVDKSNAIKFGGSLWQRVFSMVAPLYPQIKADHLFVDVAAMVLVQNPKRFDVIVTSNLFGDILSDLGAGLCGGLGLSASANINPSLIALFEPVHGSAPDIAGKNLANPFAMFLSIGMMLSYLGYENITKLIEQAIKTCLEKNLSTPDLGGSLGTNEATDEVIYACQTIGK